MSFGARFSEFGMTGAVFWISQILLLTIGIGEEGGEALVGILGSFIGADKDPSPILQSAIGSLLTVFGLIGIFVTGLILDMIGSVFFMQEMRIFGEHISRNERWLSNMTKKCSSVISEDYEDFKKEFSTQKTPIKETIIQLFDPHFHYRRFSLRFHYRRLQTFLLSYIHVYSSNGMSAQLIDHLHVWRTARAISMALLIVAIEVVAFDHFSHTTNEVTHEVLIDGTTALTIHWVLFAASAMLTLKSYNRMCYSLFTLSCATNSNQPSAKQF